MAHFAVRAAEPLSESKSDLCIFGHLVRRIAERAREREISTVKDRETGGSSKLDGLDQIIHYEIDAPDFEIEATRDLYEHTLNIEQVPWDKVTKRGWVRFTGPGFIASVLGRLRRRTRRRRARHSAHPSRPRQGAVETGDKKNPVLHRSRLVPGTRRSIRPSQGAAELRWRLPDHVERHAQPVVDTHMLGQRCPHASTPAGGTGCLCLIRGCG